MSIQLSQYRNQSFEEAIIPLDSNRQGARPEGKIGISVLRGGEIAGEHKVIFFTRGETIEFTHKALNRLAFAHGALLAAKWLHRQPSGLYNLQDVLSDA